MQHKKRKITVLNSFISEKLYILSSGYKVTSRRYANTFFSPKFDGLVSSRAKLLAPVIATSGPAGRGQRSQVRLARHEIGLGGICSKIMLSQHSHQQYLLFLLNSPIMPNWGERERAPTWCTLRRFAIYIRSSVRRLELCTRVRAHVATPSLHTGRDSVDS